jgi:hypothetical protein
MQTTKTRIRLAALCASAAAMLAIAAPASAHIVELHAFSSSFNGESSVGATQPFPFGLHDMGFNQATNQVYVGSPNNSAIYKFSASGTPEAFSGLGGNTVINGVSQNTFGDVFVENSSAAGNGRIFGFRENGPVNAYKPDGTLDVSFPSSAACGGDVAPNGKIFIAAWSGQKVFEYNNDGSATGNSFPVTGSPCDLAIDSQGFVYVVAESSGTVRKYTSGGSFVGVFDGTGSPEPELAIDRSNDHVYVDHDSYILEFDANGGLIAKFGEAEGAYPGLSNSQGIAVRQSNHAVYALNTQGGNPRVDIFNPTGPIVVPDVTSSAANPVAKTTATLNGVVNPDSVESTECYFEWGPGTSSTTTFPNKATCAQGNTFAGGSGNHNVSAEITGLTPETNYHFRLVAKNGNPGPPTRGANLSFKTEGAVKGIKTNAASLVTLTSARFNGEFDPNGETTKYFFEYGTNGVTYPNKFPAVPAEIGGTGTTPVHADVTGLNPGVTYHYRITATNLFGTSKGEDVSFKTSAPPTIAAFVSDVHGDSGEIHVQITPNAQPTTYTLEYGEEDCEISTCTVKGPASAGEGLTQQSFALALTGLDPGTTYHYKVTATNSRGTVETGDKTFTTFPFIQVLKDTCPNLLSRQQTGAALLPDCRSYELVSAANAGGYDVESDLVPGQTPLDAYPSAKDRLLYSMHLGAVPDIAGSPTNFGRDPYVASRGSEGWATKYVGLPSDAMADEGPYGSPLAGADAGLTTFAFAGENICDPCFAGLGTNMPLRLANGSLVAGMAGSEPPTESSPAGKVVKPLSADGKHLVFGSTEKFEPTANDNGTDVTIYERNLIANTTQVISTDDTEATIAAGSGVAELDISSDGSRVVIGKQVGTDGKGNALYHLYMHIGNSAEAVDLTPGATGGALFDGMTSDGSKVFFTTTTALPGDGDTSADLYESDVDSGGTLSMHRVSTGTGTGNVDTCSPAGDWNSPAGPGKCNVVAIAGGGGVASGDGTVYFLSPEQLDGGEGVPGQPNLYVVRPGGSPNFVKTIDSTIEEPAPINNQAVVHGVGQSGTRDTSDFQTTPDGDVSVFPSTLPLTGYDNAGHVELFRYDAVAESLLCVSCPPTNARATGDAALAGHGLSVTGDGRVFFTSTEPIAPRDLDKRKDAYEWSNGEPNLISTGTSPFDSSILSVSADGRDAFFFTRDVLAPQDRNGNTVKVYDAREGGGFYVLPTKPLCAASDECHGPGTQAAEPPNINTFEGNHHSANPPREETCKRGFVKKHGKCVKKRHRRRSHRHG